MTAAAEEAVGSISEMLSILMKRRDTLCLLPIEESTRCLASSSFSATMSLVNDWMVRPLGKRPTTRYACIGPATEGSALNAMGYTWTRRRNQHGCERAERSVESRRSWLMSAFLPLLLFGAPWGGAPDLPATPDVPELELIGGVSITITLDTHWTSESWNSLREYGIEPLRQLTPNRVLAWDLDGVPDSVHGWNVAVYEGGAEYRAALEPGPFTEHRVVLEPRLPHAVQQRVFNELSNAELVPEWIRVPLSDSPLPAALLIGTDGRFESWWSSIESMPGIQWVEPVLETKGRNDVAASIMEHGETFGHPAWLYGIDGSNIVIASADSGLDRDHACFRDLSWPDENNSNASGIPGAGHRKIVHVNESLDDWDTPGDNDYRHGTHVAGSLVCRHVNETAAEELGDWLNATPAEGAALSHGARLLFQDLVNDEGWVVPGPGELLWEAADNGAVIHSDSWGDDTAAYTLRTHDFDAWAMQVPWSLALIAPGNTGGEVLEPANGLNVVSVGVAAKDGSPDLWSQSPSDPTEQGRQGVLVAAPGRSIISASADGEHESWNDGVRSSTGSSMATPQAAAFGALLQQLVEDGWLTGVNDNLTNVSTIGLRPGWAEQLQTNLSDGALSLGEGFTPSGSLLRALMALSAEPLDGGTHGGDNLSVGPDDLQGWGRLNLSRIVDFEALEERLSDNASKPTNVWVHDSYRMANDSWVDLVREWGGSGPDNVSDAVASASWHGVGASGPFLATGDYAGWVVTPELGEDLDLRLAWTSRPNPELPDRLVLTVWYRDDSGWHYTCGNDFNGYYSVIHEEEDFEDTCLNATSEHKDTVSGVRVDSARLVNASHISIGVYAGHVSVGNGTLTIGMDGDRVGFSIAGRGVATVSTWGGPGAPMVEVLAPSDGGVLSDVIEVDFIAGDVTGRPVMALVSMKNWDNGGDAASTYFSECQSITVVQWMVNKCTLHLQYQSHLPVHINNMSVFVRVWVVTGGQPQYNNYDTAESGIFGFSRTPPECPLCNIELDIPQSASVGETVEFRVVTDDTLGAQFWGDVSSPSMNITWNFGDGESSTGEVVNHEFSETGISKKTYGVTVCIEYPGSSAFCDGDVIVIGKNENPITPDVSEWAVEGSILVFLFMVFAVVVMMAARYPNRL